MRRFYRINLLESVNWTWGLSLIALTIAIHATGVVMMAVAGLRIRARLETRKLSLHHVIPIVIGVVGAVGLLLAVLHGIEAAIWAAAYVWLGALNSPKDAILYSVELDDYARRFGADVATALADDGRAGGGRRHAAVWYQHGLHFRGDAGVLADALRVIHDPRSPKSASDIRIAGIAVQELCKKIRALIEKGFSIA